MELDDIKTAIIEDLERASIELFTMSEKAGEKGDQDNSHRLYVKASTVEDIRARHIGRIYNAKDEQALFDLAAFIMAEAKIQPGSDRSGVSLVVNYITRLL